MSEQPVNISKIPTIGVYVPTRGRQHLCTSTLNAWQQTAADPGNIKFVMGVDYDDESSAKIIAGEGLQIHVFDKDTITCGARVKQLSGLLDVDIYLAIVDYYFPLTQYWDNALRHIMVGGGNEIANITFAPAPQAFHVTACSKRWMSLANKFEPEIFPFWFSDQWRVEMHSYVFNKAPGTFSEIAVGGTHSNRTHNMHELPFWWGLFHALRPRRLREAYEVYKGYGLSIPTFKEFVASRRDNIDMFLRVDNAKKNQFATYERDFGQIGTPSEKYLRCKANAEKLIKAERLKLWEMKL